MNENIETLRISFTFGEMSWDGYYVTFQQDWSDFSWFRSEQSFVTTSDEKLWKSFESVFDDVGKEEFLVAVRAMEKGILLCK